MNTIAQRALEIWDSFPPVLVAAFMLAAGGMAASLARMAATGLLSLLRFDAMSERTGLSAFLRKGRVRYTPSKLAGNLSFWAVWISALLGAAAELDARLVASLGERLVALFPALIAAAIVAAVGAAAVGFIANFSETIARNAAVSGSRLIARLVRLVGGLVVGLISLEQLGVGAGILGSMLQLLFGAAVFGLALAFGLGCKDMARGAAERMFRNLRERERAEKGEDLEG